MTFFLAKNCRMRRALCEVALSCNRHQALDACKSNHMCDLFQQLVEHTFVEVRIYHLPWRNKLSMDHATRIKKCDQHRLHTRFLPPQFLWSRRPLAHPFHTLSFSSQVVRETPQFVPVTIVVKNAGSRRSLAKRSSHEATQSAFCSAINTCGTK